jgi:hypothetical protein
MAVDFVGIFAVFGKLKRLVCHFFDPVSFAARRLVYFRASVVAFHQSIPSLTARKLVETANSMRGCAG